jgi:TolB-like protein/Flp pilus assembly protein TadD
VSFVAELKQRKVFRVATVYLVVAWVAIQAASIALPAFDAPAWALRVLILLFALGLPLALLLAWALELTPEGIKLATGKVGNKRMAAIAAGLIALALAWYFVGQPTLRSRDLVRMQNRSIAVMPFVNMSGDPANDYFSDGLAETTLDMLAQVQDLKVIARTSSFAFKGKATDMREIGKTLGAAHLLEGSVQQAGDTVRITVQLIRAADGSQLWSRHFDRRMSDVFDIQDEVATAVVQALELALTKPEQQRLVRKRTDNVAAYQEYLKGIALLPERRVADMRRAAQHFERAIQLDPAYALAYVAAYDVYHVLDQYDTVSAREKMRATRYLARALELAPQLGEAHIAQAAALEAAGRYPAAETEFRLGLELAPGYATGYQWYGQFLAEVFGRFDEARPLLQRAVELDPLSPVIRAVRATHLGQSGRVDEALLLLNAAIAEHPDLARNYYARSGLHQLRGDMVAALRDLRTMETLDPDPVGSSAAQCHFLLDLDALVEARTCVATWVQRESASTALTPAQFRLAMIDGDAPAALAFLAQMQPVPEQVRASVLLGTGQAAEALAIYRKLMPGLFAQPTPQVYPGQAFDALEIGIALIKTGTKPQGRALLEAAITAIADRPYAAVIAGRGWLDVYAYVYLDQPARAFTALQAAVSSGYFLGLAELDTDPLLADLRADSRYMKILAPARARAAAQVNAARAAGLL